MLALCGHKVSSLAHHGDELNQLHHGERRLPPDGKRLASLGILGVHADKVISVHDSVNETIEDDGEVDVSIVVDMGVKPVKEENGEVVVNMEERKLSPLLSEHDEDGVPEVPDLGSVKHPQQVCDRRIFGVEVVARRQRVSVAVSQQEGLDRHVSAQHDLRNVVDKFERVGVNGRNSSFHDGGTNKNETEVYQSNSEGSREVREQPSLKRRKGQERKNQSVRKLAVKICRGPDTGALHCMKRSEHYTPRYVRGSLSQGRPMRGSTRRYCPKLKSKYPLLEDDLVQIRCREKVPIRRSETKGERRKNRCAQKIVKRLPPE